MARALGSSLARKSAPLTALETERNRIKYALLRRV